MSVNLSVNLNKVALIRNSRPHDHPLIIKFAKISLDCGASGITLHPRPDGRHVRPHDVVAVSKLLCEKYPDAELNIEGNPFGKLFGDTAQSMMDFVCDICPHQFTAVPDSENQLTSDHGWQINEQTRPELIDMIQRMGKKNIRVSLFVDPDPEIIPAVKDVGAQRVELYTEPYAQAYPTGKKQEMFDRYLKTAEAAAKYGIEVNAGHDLDLENLEMIKTLPGLKEVSIGHALTIDALRFGFAEAVSKYMLTLQI